MTDSVSTHHAPIENFLPLRRIFLTGGSGYIGRNLIRHFIARGAELTALARSEASAEVVQKLGATPFRGDLFNANLSIAMAGCDTLVHAAADTNHGLATERQRVINVDGTRAVLKAAHVAGIKRVLHISTESVLATGQPLVNVNETMPIPIRPVGCYSGTKAAAERIALNANATGFEIMVLRPRFVWGRDDTTALPALVTAVRSGKFAWISGGMYLTSTTHIANLCHAVELALGRGRGGEVYFVSDGDPISFRRIVSGLLETQGLRVPDKTVPRFMVRSVAAAGDILARGTGGRIVSPVTLQAYATSAVEVTLDISKAKSELGYAPVLSFENGLAELRQLTLTS